MEPTVEVSQVTQEKITLGFTQPFAGVLTTIPRDNDHWYSRYSQRPFAPQGDPRSFPYYLGDKRATDWGFTLTRRHLIIPRTQHLNDHAQKAGVRWQLAELGDVPAPEYINLFLKGITPIDVPRREQTGVYIHDISYHAGIIFIPRQDLAYLQSFISFAKMFIDRFLPNEEAKLPLLQLLATQIDTTTGNLYHALVHLKKHPNDENGFLRNALNDFYLKGESFAQRLISLVNTSDTGTLLPALYQYCRMHPQAAVRKKIGYQDLSQFIDRVRGHPLTHNFNHQ